MCIQALKDVYYEPLAQVLPSVDAILRGPPVMKLLFMTDPPIVNAKLKPDWQVNMHHALLSHWLQHKKQAMLLFSCHTLHNMAMHPTQAQTPPFLYQASLLLPNSSTFV